MRSCRWPLDVGSCRGRAGERCAAHSLACLPGPTLPPAPPRQVIGDGAITGGMAYEAMNHAGFLDTNMIVILNDNQQARHLGARAAARST